MAKPLITGTFTFSCKELPGVTFKMPIFKDWEPSPASVDGPGRCRIPLHWPSTIDYDEARAIYVTRETPENYADLLTKVGEKDFRAGKQLFYPVQKNRAGIMSGPVFDYNFWVAGYEPRHRQWDYLAFFLQKSLIKVRIVGGSEELGFSMEPLRQSIFETFQAK